MDKNNKEKKGKVFEKDLQIFMVRCPKCGKENWAMAVATGQCAFCGYKATKKDANK